MKRVRRRTVSKKSTDSKFCLPSTWCSPRLSAKRGEAAPHYLRSKGIFRATNRSAACQCCDKGLLLASRLAYKMVILYHSRRWSVIARRRKCGILLYSRRRAPPRKKQNKAFCIVGAKTRKSAARLSPALHSAENPPQRGGTPFFCSNPIVAQRAPFVNL
jgi:hypothetical protein